MQGIAVSQKHSSDSSKQFMTRSWFWTMSMRNTIPNMANRAHGYEHDLTTNWLNVMFTRVAT